MNRQTTDEPICYDTEQALLGYLLVRWDAVPAVKALLRPEDFADTAHRIIYDAVLDVAESKDLSALVRQLRDHPALAELGGGSYLETLFQSRMDFIDPEGFALRIRDLAHRRKVQAIAETVYTDAIDRSAAECIARAEGELLSISDSDDTAKPRGMRDVVRATLEQAEAAYLSDDKLAGVTTGIRALDRRLGGLRASDLVILAARPSMGKAQPLDAKVLTDAGWKRMGDLRMGDKLASVDGKPSRVSGVFPQGKREVYRVTFSDGRSVRACGEHLWAVESSRFKGRKVWSTDRMREAIGTARYRRRLSVPLFAGDFGGGEMPIDPWLLGALIGNGNLTGRTPIFSTADAGTLWRVQSAMGEQQQLRAVGDYDYRINGVDRVNAIASTLDALGLIGLRSHEKFIPEQYLTASKHDRLELLRGLMDTDGWVEKHGAVMYSTSSKRLAENVAELVRSLGGLCSTASKSPAYTYNGQRKTGKPHYILNIRHPEPGSLLSLARKARRAVRSKPVRLTVTAIEPDGIEDVQCIAVTHPERLYITDGYTVTHNTALAVNIATNAASDGARVLVFSLEMSAEQLAGRVIAERSGVPADKISRGEIGRDQFEAVVNAGAELDALPMVIYDRPAIQPAVVRREARRMQRDQGLDLIVIDYLQLMSPPGGKSDNRVSDVTHITAAMKEIAKELGVPVLLLSQLSRQVEGREDKRPQLSDLRDSGSIEQDADVVLFIYREEYYLTRSEPKAGTKAWDEWEAAVSAAMGKAEIITAKFRQGAVGRDVVRFEGRLTRFSDLEQEEPWHA